MFKIGKLFHLTHVVSDLGAVDRWYDDVFAVTRFYHGFGRGSCRANATCSSTGSYHPPGAECTHRTYGEPPARFSHRVYQPKGTPRNYLHVLSSQRAFHELLPDAIGTRIMPAGSRPRLIDDKMNMQMRRGPGESGEMGMTRCVILSINDDIARSRIRQFYLLIVQNGGYRDFNLSASEYNEWQ